MATVNSEHDTGTASAGGSLGAAWLRLRRAAGRAPQAAPPDLAPFDMAGALEVLAALAGKPVPRAHLLAALPLAGGDLAPRFAPFALARAGLAGQWLRLALHWLDRADLPVVAPLAQGGAVVITARIDAGHVLVRDAAGERAVAIAALQPLVADELLGCGHPDPENPPAFEADRALIVRNPLLWLAGAFMGERRKLARMLIAAALINLIALAVPLYMRAIYDRVVPNLALESLFALSAGMIIVLVCDLVLRRVKGGFIDGIGVRVGQQVQHRAISAVLDARSNRATATPGALMTGLRDVEGLAQLVPQAVVTLLIDLPFFFAYLALIALIAGWVMLAPLVGGIALMLVGVVANWGLKLASGRVSRLMQARSNMIVEVNEGWQTIKANQAEGRFLARWDILADHIAMGGHHSRHWGEMPALAAAFVMQMVTVLVVVIGVLEIRAGAMTSGALVASVMLAGRAMGPVTGVVAMAARLYQSLSQFHALAAILRADPERSLSDPAIAPGHGKGAISASGLTYRFAGAGAPVLNGLDFTIAAGERVALIGRSGSGKSTLLQILAGLLPGHEGVLTLDGHAIEQFAAAQLRQNVVLAAQDAAIFDTSIWDNILLGMEEPDADHVERAVRCSGIAQFVDRSVEGYMRKVGPRGSSLSGGQRQALILARALVRDPRVLLLDEPTAAMDITSEQAVVEGLREAAAGRTLIVATHRLALLDAVDRVIWLDSGRIVADRPRAEVLATLRARPAQAA